MLHLHTPVQAVSMRCLLAGMVLILASCAVESHLQDLADEGLGITKRVHFGSSPEAKLQAAQDLLTHASKYDQLINRSTALEYTAKARRVQRQEREAAATLMREAAADYAKRQDLATARHIYRSIITTFPEEEARPIRQSVESSLTQLDELEKGMK